MKQEGPVVTVTIIYLSASLFIYVVKCSLTFNRVKRILNKVAWRKGRRHLTEYKATTEDWGREGIRLFATESPYSFPTSHKGTI